MRVRRWMSRPVISTEPDVSVLLAHRKMVENEVRRLPVLDENGRLVGILSERDARTFLLPQELRAFRGTPAEEGAPVLVHEAMTRTVLVVHPDSTVAEAVRIMHDQKVSGLPVVEDGRCVGMITVQDLLEVLMAALDRHMNEVNEEIVEETVGVSAVPKERGAKQRARRSAVPDEASSAGG